MARLNPLLSVLALLLMWSAQAFGAGEAMCSDRKITARAVYSQEDVKAFVECAAAYLDMYGEEESRRAFHEDERWRFGPIYVFVDEITANGINARTLVYPPDPSIEGTVGDFPPDIFGTTVGLDTDRVMSAVDSGWLYYAFNNPETGRTSPKASYVIEVDWNGSRAVIGAGIYTRDWPGACREDEVSVPILHPRHTEERLREVVNCAAMPLESMGYAAKQELESNPRWNAGTHYMFVLDLMGNQVMTGNRVRVNGIAPHEFGPGGVRNAQFGGREMADVGDAFGETYMYYLAYNPKTLELQPKVSFVKRVVAQGVPLLVGAGYYTQANVPPFLEVGCADNYVEASAVRSRRELREFVRCAAEYAKMHGPEEARRAFNEDARWKHGPTYIFVTNPQPDPNDAMTHVFPPDPAREGRPWGVPAESYGSDFFFEQHRILSLMDAGWIYYATRNPATGLQEPKISYLMELDWMGERAVIGAGIYSSDLPGTCDPAVVNAADLEANPSDQQLREFVNCAAMRVESSGYFAGPVLSSHSRWRHGSIYVFGINVADGAVEFSGNPASFGASRRIPELLFRGRDIIAATDVFGEAFWYYRFNNPATGSDATKVVVAKRVQTQAGPLLVGAGYNP